MIGRILWGSHQGSAIDEGNNGASKTHGWKPRRTNMSLGKSHYICTGANRTTGSVSLHSGKPGQTRKSRSGMPAQDCWITRQRRPSVADGRNHACGNPAEPLPATMARIEMMGAAERVPERCRRVCRGARFKASDWFQGGRDALVGS